MTESIATKLTSLIIPIFPRFFLSEAETETYPYGVYDLTVVAHQDKDGEVYKLRADVTIHFIGQDFNTLDQNVATVESSINTGMNDSQYAAKLTGKTKDCTNDVYDIELRYIINQYN